MFWSRDYIRSTDISHRIYRGIFHPFFSVEVGDLPKNIGELQRRLRSEGQGKALSSLLFH